jgi:predicted DNA binding CopG/RHH family protein
MKKKLPKLTTDEAAEAFIADANLTEYDLSGLKPVRFEFQPKGRSITMRLSEPLLEALKEEAERSGMPYQRFIRQALENAVHHPQKSS